MATPGQLLTAAVCNYRISQLGLSSFPSLRQQGSPAVARLCRAILSQTLRCFQ